jgi:hypothetical protein
MRWTPRNAGGAFDDSPGWRRKWSLGNGAQSRGTDLTLLHIMVQPVHIHVSGVLEEQVLKANTALSC